MNLSRLRRTSLGTRFVALSAPLADASSLADFLSCPKTHSYSFHPSTRSSALSVQFQTSSIPHSTAFLRSMIKPAYAAMRSSKTSTICFVTSRTQCKAVARDLVRRSATEFDQDVFVGPSQNKLLELYAKRISDPDLAEALQHGIGVYPSDSPALDLFSSGAIRILLVSHEFCWTLPTSIRASLVVVLGTQYAVLGSDDDWEIRDYDVEQLLEMQGSVDSGEFLIMCQAVQVDLYARFILQGSPLESELGPDHSHFASLAYKDILAGATRTRQDILDTLSWTYLAHRHVKNPSYYGATGRDTAKYLSSVVDALLLRFKESCLVRFKGEVIHPTAIGRRLARDASDELRDALELDLSQVVELVDQASMSAQEQLDDEAFRSFYDRLPRAVRDKVGPADGDATSPGYRKKVLLAAFLARKIPSDRVLEEEQASWVSKLVEARSGVVARAKR
jgi:antiviral helicase SLH1